ncbi:MFS transporter [Arthrobacter globiformis]|uniref:MFS transporter n=1 Tax=Arthrobacter globiformis TaxID=1665 RepID=UPI00278E8F15|nr:MFS transporter [Arthrobacter globiformis]MDQ0616711.1 MFS family permease [Arthrobacter globiformis]
MSLPVNHQSSKATIDVREEIANSQLRPRHWALVCLISLAIVFDGIDTLVPSLVIPTLQKLWQLSPGQSGLLVSAGLIGFAVGSLTHGPVADRFGRRPVFVAGLLISGVLSVLTGAMGTSFEMFVILRALTGVGLGILLPLGIAYLNECMPRHARNRLSVLSAVGFSAGGVIAAIFGIFLMPTLGWQSLFYLGGTTILLAVLYHFVLPESPEFLVSRGRVAEAAAVLSRLRPERADSYRQSTLVPGIQIDPQVKDWRLPLSRTYRGRTLALWYTTFLLLFAAYGLTAWTPTLMIGRGLGQATGFTLGAVLAAVAIIGGLGGAYIADRWLGARRTVMIAAGLGAASSVGIGVVSTGLLSIITVSTTGLFLQGALFVLYSFGPQVYPVHARSTGQGLMMGVGRCGAVLGPYIGGILIGMLGGGDSLFFVVAAAAVLSIPGLLLFIVFQKRQDARTVS